MMKKVWPVLLAVVLVFGLGVFGCGGDDDGGGDKPDPDFTSDFCQNGATYELELTGNFEYGKGYQGNVSNKALFNGAKVTKDDVFTLTVSFTADRNLKEGDKDFRVGLVDRTAAADYWTPLSWTGDGDASTVYKFDTDKNVTIDLTSELTTTGIQDLTITFTALKSSTGREVSANDLTFEVDSPTDAATASERAPIKLTFTKFVFSKGKGGEAPPLPPGPTPLPEGSIEPIVTFDNFLEQTGNFGQWVLTGEQLASASHFVIIRDGAQEGANDGGFGGLKVGWQENGGGYTMSDGITSKDWTSGLGGVMYICIDLSAIEDYTASLGSRTNVRFFIGYWDDFAVLGATGAAYLFDFDGLDKPDGAIDLVTNASVELGYILTEDQFMALIGAE